MDGEDQLIEKLALGVPSIGTRAARRIAAPGVQLGIGDDAAVIVPGRNADFVITCDAFLEGVHFLAGRHPADAVGYKALARATSDIPAMGAKPRWFLLTLALPQIRTGDWLADFLRGMRRAARELGLQLIGGDTTRFASVLSSITVLGEVAPGHAVTRAGARPGDVLYVSGRLGRAQLGLEMMRNSAAGETASLIRRESGLLRQHLYPRIRTRLGERLGNRRIASAMIDVSDGLSTDLGHLCAASGVGARIWAERVPRVEIPASQSKLACKRKLDPLQMALHGGDDYELLFAVPRRRAKELRRAPEFRDLTAIGEIERGSRVLLLDADGRAKPLRPRGWDPFR
ncbi:MAG TPA: thiamine-phosphate kinase [Candidatus Aquilonibacter sp.]|nr:thiamine-phosphate kinase [Candidatus Aquilonibacter sp.]